MANLVKPDLNKLKAEIDSRKREKGMITENTQGTPMLPKDVFLNSLYTSLQTGKNTPIVNNMRTLNARADIVSDSLKKGVVTPDAINKINELKNSVASPAMYDTQPIHNTQQPQRINEITDMSPERDDLMLADLERKRRNVTLAESIENFNTTKSNTPIQPTQMYSAGGTPLLNEGYLVENVKKVVNNYLAENLAPVFEEAMKNTIIEMYAVERIKEVLKENKEIVKTVVLEVIRELQAKNKAAKAQ